MIASADDDAARRPPGNASGITSPDFVEIPEAFGRGKPADKKKPDKNKKKKSDDEEDEESDQGEKKKSDDDEAGDGEGDHDQEKKKKKPFWKRPVLLTVMIVVTLLLIAGGVIWWLMTRNYESTDDAFIDGNIVQVAPRVAGRVRSLNVNDNEFVYADTVVIDIDPAPFQATYDNAAAAVQQAQANVEQAKANVAVQEANAGQAKADVAAAQATAVNAESDYRRYLALAPPARAQQQVDSATSNYKNAEAQVVAAQAKAASVDAQVQAARTAVDAAVAAVAAAKAQLDQAALDLQYVRVTAGQDGFVTRRTVQKGNYVQVGQELLDIVPKDVWVTANFKETQLRYMRPGQPVTITVDAYPSRKYKATVQSLQTGTGSVFTTLPPENATGNFVKIVQRVPVKIVFDEPLDRVFAPGESVEPSVDIRSGRNDGRK
jgi:membrane fusion protein (multidrug efflux system)